MRILTTLLVLLLSSPVFAETYVCSYGVDPNIFDPPFITQSYIRTADGFERKWYDNPTVEEWDIVHEDERVLVLHRSYMYRDSLNTIVAQIEKSGGSRYTEASLGLDGNVSGHEGTCTVVE